MSQVGYIGGVMNNSVKIPSLSVDQLVVKRAQVLLIGAFSFGLWQFGWLATDILAQPDSTATGVSAIATVIGALGWVYTTVMLLKLNRQIKQANACSAMHDELVIKNRSTAFFQSYFILFALIWLLIPILDIWPLKAEFVIRPLAAIGVILPMVLFSVFELKNQSGAEDE